MSGIEAIAILTSISQLLELGLKLRSLVNDVYRRFNDGPAKAVFRAAHIRQLIETACLIQGKSDLQNPRVHSHVKTTLVEAERLQHILERMTKDYATGYLKKKLWKALLGHEERRLELAFERLEKEKSALVLCINFAHNEIPYIARDSVEEFIPKISSTNQGVAGLGQTFDGAEQQRDGTHSSPLEEKSLVSMHAETRHEEKNLIGGEASKVIALKHGQSRETRETRETRIPKESTKTGHIINPVSKEDATMICGDFQTSVSRDLFVKDSESKDDSLLVCGHWGGATGNYKSVAARSFGRSITIVGNVGTSSTADDAYQALQQTNKR